MNYAGYIGVWLGGGLLASLVMGSWLPLLGVALSCLGLVMMLSHL